MRSISTALGAAAALFVSLAVTVTNAAPSAHAQLVAPASYFGTGLEPGATVEVFANGSSCGSTTVTSAGEWYVIVPTQAPCTPNTGDKVTFEVDGETAAEQSVWEPGGAPENLATGLALTVTGGGTPKPPTPEVVDGLISGVLPGHGFGLVTFGGSLQQLRDALASTCESGAPIFATASGKFVGYFPTAAVDAPNAAFKALYGGGVPDGTPLLGGNCD